MTAFEHAQTAYPYPFLRTAWFGILIQSPRNNTSNFYSNLNNNAAWFIKLPLDEQGLLLQSARDDFLHRLVDALTKTPDGDFKQQSLDNNPHGFKPKDDKMAVFHAKASRQLQEPPSQYYAHAREYFSGKTGFDQWNFVGLQGIADVATRLNEDENEQLLLGAIPYLPTIPFSALCGCLENENIDKPLTRAINGRIQQALANNDPVIIAAGLRGLSNSKDIKAQHETLVSVLKNKIGQNIEILAAIAGRCWHRLENAELRLLFLEALALSDAGQKAFDNILADLLFLPGLRQLILKDFDNEDYSQQLTRTIEAFLASVQKTSAR